MPQKFTKDSDATLDYAVDWSAWLGDDIISVSTWAATEGITIEDSPAPTIAEGLTTAWLSGGTAGEVYSVTNHIVTVAGREDDRTIWLVVSER